METKPAPWLRWLARGIGLTASGFFLFAAIVSGMSKYPMPPVMLIMLALSIAGILIALRRERAGGIMAIVASAGLGAFVYSGAGHNRVVAALIYSAPFLIAGILFVICSRGRAK